MKISLPMSKNATQYFVHCEIFIFEQRCLYNNMIIYFCGSIKNVSNIKISVQKYIIIFSNKNIAHERAIKIEPKSSILGSG